MVKENLSKLPFMRMIMSGLKLTVTIIIVIMVISSLVFMLVNPTQVFAATTTRNSNSIDTSNHHSNLQAMQAYLPSNSTTPTASTAPPMASQDNDFTTQAALSLTRATQTDNLVNSKTYYDISFRTATAGIIKYIQMTFPPGTYVGAAVLIEATGIGPGTIAASGTTATGMTLTYTVTSEVNVPALTRTRIQVANINNPPDPSNSLTVTITTRNAANGVIDGPTSTSAYNMVQVGNAQIAPGAVTTTKIASGAVTTGDIADGAIQPQTISRTGTQVSVLPGSFNAGIASCLSEETAVGGGLRIVTGGERFLTLAGSSSVGTGWFIEMFNTDSVNTHSFFPNVNCMPEMP
jgi:hypothetical protein